MNSEPREAPAQGTAAVDRYDAIIVGAGMAGMYQLFRLRELGLSVRVFETGGEVGGTWYWNRYPGARFDSESYSYGYSFDNMLLQEWDWSEHFSPQPETLRYLELVADRLELRKDIEFNSRITTAVFDETASVWEVTTENGHRAQARLLISAVGILSAPTWPRIDGINSFKGEAYHTARWPHDPVDFTGKCVGVIGTGATGVQVIQEIAKTAGHLTIFQRTPNYCTPLGNRPIDDETQRRIKASYPEIFAKCRESFGGFLHESDARSTLDVSQEEREAFWERLYREPGFAMWLGNFSDILFNKEANDLVSDFVRKKIRERVRNPHTADKLCPRNHGFGTRRVPQETGYYEVYNQDNVELVDIRETPIKRITPRGVRTTRANYQIDILVYATGFDAVTGAFDRIDIRGRGGLKLKDKWADGPRTYLGLQGVGFPNFFTLVGPHNAAVFCNIPRCIEQNVEWVTDLARYMRENGYRRIEPTEAAEDEWTQHVYEMVNMTLLPTADSWFMGANVNVPNKKRTFLAYLGGAPAYRDKCDEIAAKNYEGFLME